MAEGTRHAQLLGIRKVPKVYNNIEECGSINDPTYRPSRTNNDGRNKKNKGYISRVTRT